MLRKSKVWFRKKDVWRPLMMAALLLSCSCTGSKYLKEGQTFYDGADIVFHQQQGKVGRKGTLRKELETYVTPKPNTKFLGMRPGVWIYNATGTPKKKKGFRSFLKRKFGQEPVLLEDVTPERTAKILGGYLNNEGYFKSDAASSVETKGNKSTVIYDVRLYRPYRIREIQYPQGRDSAYSAILNSLHKASLLKEKQRYQLDMLQAEQSRIEAVVENFGFYFFDDKYLIFEADSTEGDHQVDLRLRLEPGIPKKARKIYRLGAVSIFPNYSLSRDTTNLKRDTLRIDSINYIDDAKMFRPGVITRVVNLKDGEIYTRDAQETTLSHLMGLGTFKFVNIKFSEVPDTALLETNIFLTPLKKKSIRIEMQAVSKSNNFVGPGLAFTFRNRNFLRGAELFQLKLHSAYEVQINRNIKQPLNSLELGMESSLTVPRFISPIPIDYSSKRYLPKTQFRLGFNLQNRVGYFRLNSFNVAYGYSWKESLARVHELFPIDMNFVKTDKKSVEFQDRLINNRVIANSFEDQFIFGSRYSFTLNTQLTEDQIEKVQTHHVARHNFYFNGNIDIAGNLLNTLQRTFRRQERDSVYQILGSPYSQFIKTDVDFRHYFQFDKHNKLVSRVVLGIGKALGNSVTMPYIRQFSIGGSNSIRAFPARSIGPGSYNIREDSAAFGNGLFIDQRGDIKIEGNIEYRFDIIKSFKGALFVDAGNIWLLKDDEETVATDEGAVLDSRAGGKFKKDQFMKEFAVGTGIGFRFDFSFFVLRLDIAMPLRKPYLPDGQRWVVKDIDFGSAVWRKDNLIFNIAIGYPF
jgi:outer membrane protein insertion porin family